MQNGRVCKSVCLFSVCFVLLNMSESKERSKNGCVVCGRKSQGSPFRHVEQNNELEVCFGEQALGDISETCRRALQDHKTRQRHFIMLVFFSRNLYAYLLSNFTRDIKFCSERFEIYQEMVCKPAQSIIIATVL